MELALIIIEALIIVGLILVRRFKKAAGTIQISETDVEFTYRWDLETDPSTWMKKKRIFFNIHLTKSE